MNTFGEGLSHFKWLFLNAKVMKNHGSQPLPQIMVSWAGSGNTKKCTSGKAGEI